MQYVLMSAKECLSGNNIDMCTKMIHHIRVADKAFLGDDHKHCKVLFQPERFRELQDLQHRECFTIQMGLGHQ